MKRCPQCEFVYEDDQSLCDMDGSELLHDSRSLPLPAVAEITGEPESPKAKRQWRGFVVPALVGIVLAALVFAVYYAATHRGRWRDPNSSIVTSAAAQQPLPQSNSEASPEVAEEAPATDESAIDSDASEPQSNSALAARLSPGPVSAAGSPARNRGPVTIRLKNGATIKADEAWEKREGIWYRQAGVVTFVKRDRARAIERSAPPRPVTPAPAEKKADPKPAEPRKESKVTSILKKTGRILKRPFRF